MNIVLLGHREFASNLAISLVASKLSQFNLRIFLSGKHTAFHSGCPEIQALEAFEESLCEQITSDVDQTSGILSFSALEELCGHPIGELKAPNSPAGLKLLEACAPDLILSLRYRRILHADAIAIPQYGVINWHSGLLPEYQGVMATFWAMRNQDKHIGSTCHYIVDKGIDTGPIINRSTLRCNYNASYLQNVHALYVQGYHMMVNAVNTINHLQLPITLPHAGEGCYFHAPVQADLDQFRDSGNKLFDGKELDAISLLLRQVN